MGIRLNKRIKLAKGLNMNLSKKGIGFSFGGKGGRIGIGPTGIRSSVFLPGSGIRYEKRITPKKRKQPKASRGRNSVTVKVPAKMGIIVRGKKVYEETRRVPITIQRPRRPKRKRGCFGCATLPLLCLIVFVLFVILA